MGGTASAAAQRILAAIKFDIQRRGVLTNHDALYENFEEVLRTA
jgi:hypothetical protein